MRADRDACIQGVLPCSLAGMERTELLAQFCDFLPLNADTGH